MAEFIVVAQNSNNQLAAFGSPTGKPLGSEEQAEKWAKRMEKRAPHLICVVLPLQAMPEEMW